MIWRMLNAFTFFFFPPFSLGISCSRAFSTTARVPMPNTWPTKRNAWSFRLTATDGSTTNTISIIWAKLSCHYSCFLPKMVGLISCTKVWTQSALINRYQKKLSRAVGWITFNLVSLQPRENFNEWRLIYFISFLLLVGFFVLNMFVGVVVENFHRCRAEQEKEERARRAAKRAKKIEERRRSKNCWLILSMCQVAKITSPSAYSFPSRETLFSKSFALLFLNRQKMPIFSSCIFTDCIIKVIFVLSFRIPQILHFSSQCLKITENVSF